MTDYEALPTRTPADLRTSFIQAKIKECRVTRKEAQYLLLFNNGHITIGGRLWSFKVKHVGVGIYTACCEDAKKGNRND